MQKISTPHLRLQPQITAHTRYIRTVV